MAALRCRHTIRRLQARGDHTSFRRLRSVGRRRRDLVRHRGERARRWRQRWRSRRRCFFAEDFLDRWKIGGRSGMVDSIVFQMADRQRSAHVIDEVSIEIAEDLRSVQAVGQTVVLRRERARHELGRAWFARGRGVEGKHGLRFERRAQHVLGPGSFECGFLEPFHIEGQRLLLERTGEDLRG